MTAASPPPSLDQSGTPRLRATSAVSKLLTKLLKPAARKRGFAEATIIEEWQKIVGPQLAGRCSPLKLEFARGATQGSTLVLQASGGAALELQHAAPQIVERVNDYYGFRAVRRLRFVQAPRRLRRRRPAPEPLRKLSADEEASIEADIAGIELPELQDALRGLGRALRARKA